MARRMMSAAEQARRPRVVADSPVSPLVVPLHESSVAATGNPAPSAVSGVYVPGDPGRHGPADPGRSVSDVHLLGIACGSLELCSLYRDRPARSLPCALATLRANTDRDPIPGASRGRHATDDRTPASLGNGRASRERGQLPPDGKDGLLDVGQLVRSDLEADPLERRLLPGLSGRGTELVDGARAGTLEPLALVVGGRELRDGRGGGPGELSLERSLSQPGSSSKRPARAMSWRVLSRP